MYTGSIYVSRRTMSIIALKFNSHFSVKMIKLSKLLENISGRM